ncbi:MAG TPA: hypothetical protein VFO89_03235 [Thermoanaerobaculia bacterium]|nr:hypothetical protein [Thermoanaerobaculia bacterium]
MKNFDDVMAALQAADLPFETFRLLKLADVHLHRFPHLIHRHRWTPEELVIETIRAVLDRRLNHLYGQGLTLLGFLACAMFHIAAEGKLNGR